MNFIKNLFNSEKRAYRRMTHRHRKELIKEVKNNTYDFDFDELHSLVMLKIKHFYEYYNQNKNVWQTETSRQKVLEELKEILTLNEELENLFNKEESIFFEFQKENYPSSRSIFYKEKELYQILYTSIGRNIMNWWD